MRNVCFEAPGRTRRLSCLAAVLMYAIPVATWPIDARHSVVYSFTWADVAYGPGAPLVLGPDGAFYSTTTSANHPARGSIYRLTAAGELRVLHEFGPPDEDGVSPDSGLLLGQDGSLYGTVWSGGSPERDGVVYRISTGGDYEILHRFGLTEDSSQVPNGKLVQTADGLLWGSTVHGEQRGGTIFNLDPSTPVRFSTFHEFPPENLPRSGSFVGPITLGPDGAWYGTMNSGGGPNGGGVVFRVSATGEERIIHVFGESEGDGRRPVGGLIVGTDGNLYGTTEYGGRWDRGTIFRLTLEGQQTVLYSFGSVPGDGGWPDTPLIQMADGSLLGTTACGGVYAPGDDGCPQFEDGGTVFMLAPNGAYTQLHSFGEGVDSPGGARPRAELLQTAPDTFYGTTSDGGTAGRGTVFKIVLDPTLNAPGFQSEPVPIPPSLPPPEPEPGADPPLPPDSATDPVTNNHLGGGLTAPLLLGLLAAATVTRRRSQSGIE